MSSTTIKFNMRELTEHGVLMDNSKNIINDNFRKLFKEVNNLIIDSKGVSSIEYNSETNTLTINYTDREPTEIKLADSNIYWGDI